MTSDDIWQPEILDLTHPSDKQKFDSLQTDNKIWRTCDTIDQQIEDLVRTRNPQWIKRPIYQATLQAKMDDLLAGLPRHEYGRWVYFPWAGEMVHLLPPDEFRELRLNRNRNKITLAEQNRLAELTIGVVGLSVGNAVATALAIEGIGGTLKLADFDALDLSNMNRIRASVCDISVAKTVMCARQIFEMNPYAQLDIFSDGLNEENIDLFFDGGRPLDIVIDECDGIRVKFLLREKARAMGIPVLMETSDRGMLDVERFDLEPNRPLFHGLLGETTSSEIPEGMTNEEKVPFVAPIVGLETLSARMGASMVEIGETISTWPQLGSEVQLGGATVSAAVRKLVLDGELASGRRYIDLAEMVELDQEAQDRRPVLSEAEVVTQRTAKSRGDVQHRRDISETVYAKSNIDEISEFMHFVVSQAVLAPSGGNVQPWKFVTDNETLWVLHDKVRSKNLLDPDHRGAFVGLGAAIENIRIAAAARGIHSDVDYEPHAKFSVDGSDEVVAAIEFATDSAARADAMSALFPALAARMTDRKIYGRTPLTVEQRGQLLHVADQRDCHLTLIEDEATLHEIAAIIGEGDRLRFLQPETHRELMSEIRWTEQEAKETGDGIGLVTMELSAVQATGIRMMRRTDVAHLLHQQNGGKGLMDLSVKAIHHASAVGLICVDGQATNNLVQGGQSLQRLWLEATQLGLAWHPMTSLLYMFNPLFLDEGTSPNLTARELTLLDALRERFNKIFSTHDGCSQLMLFRLSQGDAAGVRSLRRPLEDALFFEGNAAVLDDRYERANFVQTSN